MNVSETKGLKDFPAEVLINFMASMPSPITLLNFLTASPYTHSIYRRFHCEILSRVLTTEAPGSVQIELMKKRPVSYGVALRAARIRKDPATALLEVPVLKKPMVTLIALVLATISDEEMKTLEELRSELEAREPDRELQASFLSYWRQRLVAEEAYALVSSLWSSNVEFLFCLFCACVFKPFRYDEILKDFPMQSCWTV